MAPYLKPQDVITVHWYPGYDVFLADYLNGVPARAGGRETWLTETGKNGCDQYAKALQMATLHQTYSSRTNSLWTGYFVYVLKRETCSETLLNDDWTPNAAFLEYQKYTTVPGRLGQGHILIGTSCPGQGITSRNGLYQLIYQCDGNLVLYGPGGALWATMTGGPAGYAFMQSDGNFVVYNGNSVPVFYTATSSPANAGAYLEVGDDGYVRLLHGIQSGIVTLWTSPNWQPPPTSTTAFYDAINYGGGTLTTSTDMSFVGWDWNDRISSVRVAPGQTITLYEAISFGGQSLTLTADAPDLRQHPGPGPDGTWDNVVSSIRMSAPPAPTGRWKLDGNGGCYFDPNDSGPNQCNPPAFDLGATTWSPRLTAGNRPPSAPPDVRLNPRSKFGRLTRLPLASREIGLSRVFDPAQYWRRLVQAGHP